MAQEISIRSVKKGTIITTCNIPVDADFGQSGEFTPKTITKIILIVNLSAGASMTLTISGKHTFTVAGEKIFEIYTNVFTENGIVEIPAGSFHKYALSIQTDGSTTGQFYIFFEYDYDLIK